MSKKTLRFLLVISMLVLFVSACQYSGATEIVKVPITPTSLAVATQAPTVVPTQTVIPATIAPTDAPIPVVISSQNISHLKQIYQIPVQYPYRLVWTADGRRLLTASSDSVFVINPQTGAVLTTYAVAAPIALVDISPDGKTAALLKNPTTLELVDVTSGVVERSITLPGANQNGAFSPDGSQLALTSSDEYAVSIWDVASGTQKQTLKGFESASPVYGVHFSMDGKYIIWVARAQVQVQNIETGKLGASLSHEEFVSAAVLSPDSSVMAVGAAGTVGGTYTPFIRLWDPQKGLQLADLITTQMPILAYSPDGKILAAGSATSIVFFDTSTRLQIYMVTGPTDSISNLAFSPDGTRLAVASADSTVRIWMLVP